MCYKDLWRTCHVRHFNELNREQRDCVLERIYYLGQLSGKQIATDPEWYKSKKYQRREKAASVLLNFAICKD